MGLAKESLPYLGVGLAVGFGGILLGFTWLGGIALALSGFIAFFFRDPARTVPSEPGILVAPADGRVTEVAGHGTEGGFRISIFLSLFDVHINRSPVAGRIERVEYKPGRFLPANLGRASIENERNDITLAAGIGRVRLAQIAGIVARRIVCWKKEGDDVATGERIGLIQFGSRVEVLLPPGARPEVRVGSRVRGGSSILARVEGSRPTGNGGELAQTTGR